MRRFSPSSSALASSTAKRMKVPSKKPPANPTVQLLTWAERTCSPAVLAVVAERVPACAISKEPKPFCPAHGDTPSKSVRRQSAVDHCLRILWISCGGRWGSQCGRPHDVVVAPSCFALIAAETGQAFVGFRRTEFTRALVPLASFDCVWGHALDP